jgi:hypothetical protein
MLRAHARAPDRAHSRAPDRAHARAHAPTPASMPNNMNLHVAAVRA